MSRNGDIPSTSEYTGVLYVNKGIHGKWKATIKHQGRKIVLGIFDKEEDAARAFDRAAVKYRGAGARTNFPILDYSTELASWTPDTKDSPMAPIQQPTKRPRTTSSEDRQPPLPPTGILDQTPLIASANFKPKAPVTDVRPTPINARGANAALDAVQSAISNVMQQPLEKFMRDASTINNRQQRALDWCRSQIFAAQQPAGGSESSSEDKLAEQLHHEQQHEQHQPTTPTQQSPPKHLGGPVVATLRVGADGQRKYRGVSWVAEKGKWRAQLSGIPGQKKMHLGYFATAEEAAAAYDAAAFTALGNAAHLNFRPPSNLITASASPAAAFTMGAQHPTGPRPRGRPRKNPDLLQPVASPLPAASPGMGLGPQQLLGPKEHGAGGDGVVHGGPGTGTKKSRYMGVSQMKSGAYLATMKDRDGNKVRLGMFFTEEEAARAYDAAVLAARGSTAKTNFHDYGDPSKAKAPTPARTPGPRTRKAAATAAAATAAASADAIRGTDLVPGPHSAPASTFSNGFAASLPTQVHGSQPPLHLQQQHHAQQLQQQQHQHQQPVGTVPHNPMQTQPVIYMPHTSQQQMAAPTTSQTAQQVAVGVTMPGSHMHSPSTVAPGYTYTGPVATPASAFAPLDSTVFGYSADAPGAAAAAAASQYTTAPLGYSGAAYNPAAQPMQQQYAAARGANSTAYSGQWPYWGRT